MERVALVTGASSGIGRATVEHLRRQGALVMAVARREELLEQLAAESGAVYYATSLDTQEACEAAVEETTRRLGSIGILVNNAAIGSASDTSLVELDRSTWRSMAAVNLEAPMWLSQLAARDMVAAGWGRIVNVSSTSALVGETDSAAYCVTKAGLLGMTRSIALDLARHGVTCNAVLPGWVRTEMSERSALREAAATGVTPEEVWRRRAAAYPAGKVVTSAEVAATIAFLASEEASGVHGESIVVAGGGTS